MAKTVTPTPALDVIPRKRFDLIQKRALDIVGASTFFVLFAWVFILVWVMVLFTTGSPGIYKHMRIGKRGKVFPCLKFRSMVVNSDEILAELLSKDPEAKKEWSSTFKLKNDPRITKFGRFIRKTSLDELPQFWNVLMGDMSLVGPRPVVKKELDQYYGAYAAAYLSVKPGITGPWQVGGRSDVSYDERVAMDVAYSQKWSVLEDIKIIFRTIGVFTNTKGSY